MEGLHRRPDPHHHHPWDQQPVVASTTPFFDFIDRLSEKATEHQQQQQRHQGCGDEDEEDNCRTPLLLSTVGIRSACPSSRSGTLLMSFARELTANWTQDHHELSECFRITTEAVEASHDHRTVADHNRPPEPTFRSRKGNDELFVSPQSPSSMSLPRRVLERDSLLGYRQAAAAALEPKSSSDNVERTEDDRYMAKTNYKMDSSSAGAAGGFVASTAAAEAEREGGSLPWLLLYHSERSDRRLLFDMWLHRWHRIASAAGIGCDGGPITTTPSSKSPSSSQTAERATVSALSPDEIRRGGAPPSLLIQETSVASLKRETQMSSNGPTSSNFLGPSSSSSSAVVGVNVASHNEESALSLLPSDNAASPSHSFRKEGLRFLRSRQQHQTQQSHHD